MNILITAYQRQQQLDELVAQLHGHTVTVFDDYSTPPLRADVFRVVRAPANYGKRMYWRWVNRIFSYIQDEGIGEFVILPDDFAARPEAVRRSIELWAEVKAYDPLAICLSIMRDERCENWTGYQMHEHGPAVLSQWVDGAFIADRAFCEALDWRVYQIPKWRFRTRAASSGVWEQASRRLVALGHTMYHVPESLFVHRHGPSMMHPGTRTRNPIRSI